MKPASPLREAWQRATRLVPSGKPSVRLTCARGTVCTCTSRRPPLTACRGSSTTVNPLVDVRGACHCDGSPVPVEAACPLETSQVGLAGRLWRARPGDDPQHASLTG